METKVKLTKAILKVMSEVKGVEKNLSVGAGNNSYKGVSDQDVKKIVGGAMAKNGLTIIPINIEPTVKVERWQEETNYGVKQKQSVFTEVKVTYLLMHESGENMEIIGYGHGVDSQDKSAGKATTYALKYALLYTFLVPTGAIDDADTEHSEARTVQAKKVKPVKQQKTVLDNDRFDKAFKQIQEGKYTVDLLEKTFNLTAEQKKVIEEIKTLEDAKK